MFFGVVVDLGLDNLSISCKEMIKCDALSMTKKEHDNAFR